MKVLIIYHQTNNHTNHKYSKGEKKLAYNILEQVNVSDGSDKSGETVPFLCFCDDGRMSEMALLINKLGTATMLC